MAKFSFDTDEQTITIIKVELASEEEFAKFLDGLINAGAVLGWGYPNEDSKGEPR